MAPLIPLPPSLSALHKRLNQDCYSRAYDDVLCDTGLSRGARWGIGFGVAVGVIAIAGILYYCCRSRRESKSDPAISWPPSGQQPIKDYRWSWSKMRKVQLEKPVPAHTTY